ncbi:asparagine synthase (glutamine-hydrolyzing) [Azohydromonas lata]|uniref:asparagine synthase (glutamine-hydrolyzing) n=1 Tax=Azohydromonas lata TaxID=45677 RepID=A0ABU5IKH3_9BURK|nr:asparagine synthase (glutamine-hydrolyzing) [Azohydromonas lata]MDZ5459407.1 asparagine synthase (glutamine-hydrolyzing) [Azohydromonas lata]
MCGIHGIYRFDGQRVEPATISAMGRVTQHRGPDDEGWHIEPAQQRCAIGMRRLSIIDLAGGHQPISNADDTTWIVCNGEVYNFRELRAELQQRGVRFKTGSDTEVMLHLYDQLGDEFVHRLDGMFNFALWDARRRRLLIGRDHLGVKPLYVHHTRERLAFATEAKALLALPDVTPQLNREALADYLHLGYVAAPHSMFRGIAKLPPATMLSIEDGQVKQWRYWRLPSRQDHTLSASQWVERTRAALDAAVHRQMVSDVPIGAFLSGGVDSSAVVGFMAKHSEAPIRTYAIGFDGGEAEQLYNELPYARQVSQLFKTEHHEIVVKPDVVGLLPRLLWHMDEPVADSAFVTTYLVSEFARRDVTVILSGVGGDELFGGYRRYLGEHYAAKFGRLPSWARDLMVRASQGLPVDRHSQLLNKLRLARGFLESASLSPDERYRRYLQVLGQDHVAELLKGAAAPTDALAAAFASAGDGDALNRMFAVDAETQLPDDLLMLTDKMSMAVSLECRVPLLDKALVEMAASIPQQHKVPGTQLKHLMKQALSDMLPREILYRAKRGFGTPMGAWLKHELAPVLARLLGADVVRARGLFEPRVVSRLVADHQANRMDGTDVLISLMNLEIWSRIYLDRRSHEDVTAELKSFLAR